MSKHSPDIINLYSVSQIGMVLEDFKNKIYAKIRLYLYKTILRMTDFQKMFSKEKYFRKILNPDWTVTVIAAVAAHRSTCEANHMAPLLHPI